MNWDDLRHFLALARTGSARAAGAAIGVSHSTIVRRVDALETQLATRLFDRARDGYRLTPAGRAVRTHAEHLEAEVAALERQLAGRDDRLAGPVSITCCDDYVSALVLDALGPLCAAHPDIEPTLTVDGRNYDLDHREADIALRAIGRDATPSGHLIGRRLAPIKLASYVARRHADQIAPDRDAPAARWLGFERRPYVTELIATSSYPHLPTWGAFTSLPLMHRAARRGLGVALLTTYVGDPDPELRRLTQPNLRHLADLWMLSHPDLRDNARLHAVRAAIVDTFTAHANLFTGDPRSDIAPAGPKNAPQPAPRDPIG